MKFIRETAAKAKAWWAAQTAQTRREITIGAIAATAGVVVGYILG